MLASWLGGACSAVEPPPAVAEQASTGITIPDEEDWQQVGNCWAVAFTSWASTAHRNAGGTSIFTPHYLLFLLALHQVMGWSLVDDVQNAPFPPLENASLLEEAGATFGSAFEFTYRYGAVASNKFLTRQGQTINSERTRAALGRLDQERRPGGRLSDPAKRSLADVLLVFCDIFDFSDDFYKQFVQRFVVGNQLRSFQDSAEPTGSADPIVPASGVPVAGRNRFREGLIDVGTLENYLGVAAHRRTSQGIAERQGTMAWRVFNYEPAMRDTTLLLIWDVLTKRSLPVMATWVIDLRYLHQDGLRREPYAGGLALSRSVQGSHGNLIYDLAVAVPCGSGRRRVMLGDPTFETIDGLLARIAIKGGQGFDFLRTKNAWDPASQVGSHGDVDFHSDYFDTLLPQCAEWNGDVCQKLGEPVLPLRSLILPNSISAQGERI